jgi:hypothetical protein
VTYKYQYTTPEERESIISQNAHLFLIEEQNLITGDFLIFSNSPTEVKEIEVVKETIVLSKEEFDALQTQVIDLEMAIAAILGGAE